MNTALLNPIQATPVTWTPRLRFLGAALGLSLALSAGCRTLGPEGGQKQTTLSALFTEREHKLRACMRDKAFEDSFTKLPDSVLFFDADSRIRIKPPRAPGAEVYHAHLLQRVGGQLLDQCFPQDAQGLIEIDLARYSDPESLIISSAAHELRELAPSATAQKADPAAKPEAAILPPYIVSYRLLPAETASDVLALQPFRYEIDTPLGTLTLLATSFNRMDQQLTLIDPGPERKLSAFLAEDPYIGLARHDVAIIPRLTVEVQEKTGQTWQRTGTWHMPAGLERVMKPGEKPFVLRLGDRDLISFEQPPRVDFKLPDHASGTSARIGASFTGLREKDELKFVLAGLYPLGQSADFGASVSTHDVDARTKDAQYSVSLEGLPREAFPLTGSLTHRLVTPWRLTAGRFAPEPPRGKVVLKTLDSPKPGKGPGHVLFARYASHYDFLLFFGGSGHERSSGLASAFRKDQDKDAGPSPNLTPPPGGSGGDSALLILPKPPAFSAASSPAGGGAMGGGDDSPCKCGKDGVNCPASQNRCNGRCGQHCQCKDKDEQDNSITIPLTCEKKGTGCQHLNACHCGSHSWIQADCLGIIQGLAGGAADLSWFGPQGGMAPCHTETPVARLRVSFWGQGIHLKQTWYTVKVTFGPCTPKPPPKKKKETGDPPEKAKDSDEPPANSGGPTSGNYSQAIVRGNPGPLTGGALIGGGPNTNTVPQRTSSHPYNDPGLMGMGAQMSGLLQGLGALGNSVTLPVDVFSPPSFARLRSEIEGNLLAFSQAYWGGESAAPLGLWNPSLTTTWALPLAPSVGTSSTSGGSGGSGGSATPPPPPPPPPPGPGPTRTKR